MNPGWVGRFRTSKYDSPRAARGMFLFPLLLLLLWDSTSELILLRFDGGFSGTDEEAVGETPLHVHNPCGRPFEKQLKQGVAG